MSQVSTWTSGGNCMWASSCDWQAGDIGNVQVTGDQCSTKCAQTAGCTHFTWTPTSGSTGTCWMKGGSVSAANAFINSANGNQAVCGYMTTQPAPSPSPVQPSVTGWTSGGNCMWASGCDWKASDIGNAQVAGSQCSTTCAQTAGCTHFTWTPTNGGTGTCWMKGGSVTAPDAFVNSANSNQAVCGYMTSQPAPSPVPQPSPVPGSQAYSLVHNHTPDSMLAGQGWTFFTDADPTHGTVQYINKAQAGNSMYYVGNDNGKYLYMGSRQTGGGAPQSLRLTSVDTLNSGLVIFDALHIPSGCGTWPAFWTVGSNWPNNGEIDFMEGVNGVGNNVMTLHTGPGCSMNLDGSQKSCLGNQGCGTTSSHSGTFGNSFNAQGGGVYAMEWLPNPASGGNGWIKVWSFPRNGIPADITNGKPTPSSWPTNNGAYAYFQFGSNCPTSAFVNHQIVIDLTFCGDWAGAVFANQCSATGRSCSDYVSNDPNALNEAYFKIKGIQVYKLN